MGDLSAREERLPWVWWQRNEPEDGLLGFHTKDDLDRFSSGGSGPYRRRISKDGRTISQTATWEDFMAGVRSELEKLDRGSTHG